jgi:hypothetical protein
MKKIIVSFSLLVAIGVTAVSAAPAALPDPRIEKILQKEFTGAEHVKWGEEEGYITASFVWGGQRTQAWFNKEGELVGSIRGISFTQLPLVVIRSVQARFTAPVLIELREVTNLDGTRYKLILEDGAKKFKVSLLPDGMFDEIQKVKK